MGVNNNFPYPNKIIEVSQDFLRKLSFTIENNVNGKTNNTGEFTIEASEDSTAVSNILCNANSVVLIIPTTANAATEHGSGNLYIEAGDGSFEVFHNNSATTGRTFKYTIVG